LKLAKPYNGYFFTEVKVSRATALQVADNFSVEGIFFRSSKVVEATNASSYGHLPSVDALNVALAYQDSYPYVLGELNASGNVSHIVVDPSGLYPANSKDNEVFYPAQVSAAEILTGAAPMFKTEQVDYINPSGNITGNNYVWQDSNTELEPIFEVTDQNRVQAESDDAFLAGIAFGVAGGAAIAVLQEVHRRRRKSYAGA
jgi:hypothetical protein